MSGANALTRTAPLVLRMEPSFTVSTIRRVSTFAEKAQQLGEFLVDVKADMPEPTCSAIDAVLSDVKECRKLADKYSRSMPDEETLRDFVSAVDTALWGAPDDLETLRHANAQLRDAVCHLGSYCHEAGRLLLDIASADTRPKGGDATQIEAPFTSGAVPSETSADAQPLPPLSDSSNQSREIPNHG